MSEMTKKQYEEMMSNKPAKKQVHHSLATVIGAKSQALESKKERPYKPINPEFDTKKFKRINGKQPTYSDERWFEVSRKK